MKKKPSALQSEDVIDPSIASRITLKEIANIAGVSIGTASNVINNKHSLMSLETRRKVEKAVLATGYRVNNTGRTLRSAINKNIAFVALEENPSFLEDPFTSETLAGFSNALSGENYNTIITRVDPRRIEEHKLFHLDDVVGLCMNLQGTSRERRTVLDKFASLRLPIVLIEEPDSYDVPDICFLQQDDFGGGILLAQHVIERGARSVLIVRQEADWHGIEERERGMMALLGNSRPGIEVDRLLVDHMNLIEETTTKLNRFLDRKRPNAIMGTNDQIAAIAWKVLLQRGKSVSEDVLVTGFNGFPVFDVLPFELTTIRSAAYQLGYQSGKEILHRVRYGSFRERLVRISVSLQARKSA